VVGRDGKGGTGGEGSGRGERAGKGEGGLDLDICPPGPRVASYATAHECKKRCSLVEKKLVSHLASGKHMAY